MISLRKAFRAFKHRRRVKTALRALEGAAPSAVPHDLDTPLIVSLTSYPARYEILHQTLQCLLRQSIIPNETILWIAHADLASLPQNVHDLTAHGLKILPCDDLKSYKKILPTLEAFPNATIVTADDDVYYPPNWLESLVQGYHQSKARVVCLRAHEIVTNKDGEWLPYVEWRTSPTGPLNSWRVFPTGVGGVLYRPDAFDPRILDREAAKTLSPTADDVWLYWMHRLTGGQAYLLPGHRRVLEWDLEPLESLRQDNVDKGCNDLQIVNMINRFGFPSA